MESRSPTDHKVRAVMLELPTARGRADRTIQQGKLYPTLREKAISNGSDSTKSDCRSESPDSSSSARPASARLPLQDATEHHRDNLRRPGLEDFVGKHSKPECDHDTGSGSDSSSTSSGSDSSSTHARNTPSTTPSSTPASACLSLLPTAYSSVEDMTTAFAFASTLINSTPLPVAVSNISDSGSVSERSLFIKAVPPPLLSNLDHIESIIESSELRTYIKNSRLRRTVGTSTRRGPFTARSNYVTACLTHQKRIKALYSIVASVQMEDGTFMPFNAGLDSGSPWTWLYFERWKGSEQEVDTLEYKDESKVKVAAVNNLTLKFYFQSTTTVDSRTVVLAREENLEVEVAESGTQDTAVFTKSETQGPHGLFGLAPANVAYYNNVGERQTILKSMYVENLGNVRGMSEASHKFAFVTLHLREEDGFVKFGEPDMNVTWFSTKLTGDWSLMLNIDVMTVGTQQRVERRSAHLLVDCGQSITTGPPTFVEEIYNLLGIRWRKELRWVIHQPGAPGRWWTGYYIADQDIMRHTDIAFRDPNSSHQVSFKLPPKFWNMGGKVIIDGESWRFGPLQIEESDIVLGWNFLEFMDVHLKSNFDKDKHQIGFTQNLGEFA